MNWLWFFTIGLICIGLVIYNLVKSKNRRKRR